MTERPAAVVGIDTGQPLAPEAVQALAEGAATKSAVQGGVIERIDSTLAALRREHKENRVQLAALTKAVKTLSLNVTLVVREVQRVSQALHLRQGKLPRKRPLKK